MDMKSLVFTFVGICLFCSCVPAWHAQLTDKPCIDACMNNAMVDFIHTCKLMKTDTVFAIFHSTSEYYFDIKDDNVCIVVAQYSHPILPYPEEVAGAKARSREFLFWDEYIEIKDKLFLINRDNVTRDSILTQDYLDVLKKYNRLDYSWFDEGCVWPPYGVDDGIEHVYYFFCPNNPKKYKKSKVVSHFFMKGLRKRTPSVKCD